jgi:hypothetical protein
MGQNTQSIIRVKLFAAACLFATVPSTGTAAEAPVTKPQAPASHPVDPKPAPRAARSVHLHWSAPEGTEFYNEMTVERSTPGTYFMACGFGHGYFGMQELAGKNNRAGDNGKTDKVVIFSIWDTRQGDNAKAVPEEQRVELLAKGDDVRTGRFGGEGTGGQSFYTYPWKIGETCRFDVQAKVEGDKTAYTAYFYRNDTKQWQLMATFRTAAGGKALNGYYSFVEDFRRDGKSATERREARYGNGWVKALDGGWVSLSKARFTGDRTPSDNVDAGLVGNLFYLVTGGETVNTTKLNATIVRSAGNAAP